MADKSIFKSPSDLRNALSNAMESMNDGSMSPDEADDLSAIAKRTNKVVAAEFADLKRAIKSARPTRPTKKRVPREPFKFTRARLRDLQPETREYYVSDTEQPGLKCRVLPSGGKTLGVRKQLKCSRKTTPFIPICKVDAKLIVDDRRNTARDYIQALEKGINPVEEIRKAKAAESIKGITLQDALDGYLTDAARRNPRARKKPLAKNTVNGYRGRIETHYSDWLKRPIEEITGDEILTRHLTLCKKAKGAAANNAVTVLRIMLGHHGLDPVCLKYGKGRPLSKVIPEHMTEIVRREGCIEQQQLADWWAATEAITDTRPGTRKEQVPVYAHGDGALGRDYLQFIILTGLRRREAAQLVWENVDLDKQTFTVVDTKNHTPLQLPLTDYLLEILERRKKATGEKGRIFPIDEPRRVVDWVRKESGVDFTVHDLRRTFVTIAESLDIGLLTIKALVNHRLNDKDVTGGYARINTERLREPMQRITDYVLKHAGVKESADVVSIEDKRHG